MNCLSRRFLTPTFGHCPNPPLRVSIACDQFRAMETFTASALFGWRACRSFTVFLQIIFIRSPFATSNRASIASLATSRCPEFVLLMDIDVRSASEHRKPSLNEGQKDCICLASNVFIRFDDFRTTLVTLDSLRHRVGRLTRKLRARAINLDNFTQTSGARMRLKFVRG